MIVKYKLKIQKNKFIFLAHLRSFVYLCEQKI